MKISLPRRGERNPHLPGDVCAERSYIAGAGNLHEIGAEVAQHRLQLSKMPKKEQVVIVRPVERKFYRTARQLQARYRA